MRHSFFAYFLLKFVISFQRCFCSISFASTSSRRFSTAHQSFIAWTSDTERNFRNQTNLWLFRVMLFFLLSPSYGVCFFFSASSTYTTRPPSTDRQLHPSLMLVDQKNVFFACTAILHHSQHSERKEKRRKTSESVRKKVNENVKSNHIITSDINQMHEILVIIKTYQFVYEISFFPLFCVKYFTYVHFLLPDSQLDSSGGIHFHFIQFLWKGHLLF